MGFSTGRGEEQAPVEVVPVDFKSLPQQWSNFYEAWVTLADAYLMASYRTKVRKKCARFAAKSYKSCPIWVPHLEFLFDST